MYLREKRRREREQRAREQAEAVVAELRGRVSALEEEKRAREQAETVIAQLQKEVRTLQDEVIHLRGELDAAQARAQSPRNAGTD